MIDDKAFTQLLLQPKQNYHAICETLNTLVRQLITAPAFYFPNPADREDAVQQAVVETIERIGKYDPKRGGSAFAFFTTVAWTRLLKIGNRQRRHRLRNQSLDQYLSDRDTYS